MRGRRGDRTQEEKGGMRRRRKKVSRKESLGGGKIWKRRLEGGSCS